MTCYRICHGGECIAIVTSPRMAQAIALCQAPGYYRVVETEVDVPSAKRRGPARWPAIRHPRTHPASEPDATSARKHSLRPPRVKSPRSLRNDPPPPANARSASPPRT